MGVFDKMGDAISNVSKDVVDKVKSNNDIGKLKQQIEYEEAKIYDGYIELGKDLFENKPENISEAAQKVCTDIDARLSRISRIKIQINDIKGIKICPACGATITNNFLFCGLCGAKLPDSTNELSKENSLSPAKKPDGLAFAD